MFWTVVDSPIDPLLIGDETGLRSLWMAAPRLHAGRRGVRDDDAALAQPAPQLAEYFAGERTRFELALGPARHPVPAEGLAGPARHPVRADHDVRRDRADLGQADAASRAVGLANGRNPLAVSPLPPGDRRQRRADRLRRRAAAQADRCWGLEQDALF